MGNNNQKNTINRDPTKSGQSIFSKTRQPILWRHTKSNEKRKNPLRNN